MTKDARSQRVLILTVGTGNPNDLEGSLYAPLQKSISLGSWTQVVFFPSQNTKKHARELKRRYAESDIAFTIRALPEPGMEDDADACFAFFNKKLRDILKDADASQVLVDFTRGTKAMSAALVLAAAAHEVPRFRYISGDRGGPSSTVIAGMENVGTFDTQALHARKQLDTIRSLFRHGRSAAVLDLLPPRNVDPMPPKDLHESTLVAIRPLAEFFGAWDRLDYQGAAETLKTLPRPRVFPPELREFLPHTEVKGWVRRLAKQPNRSKYAQFATWLRLVVCDVLANGERRLHNGELEDALIRAYRVLEMLGQIRLFDKGLDSSALPESDRRIDYFQDHLRQKSEKPLAKARTEGCLEATRERAARLLEWLGDPLGPELLEVAKETNLSGRRNQSILNHEFAARAPDSETLKQVYEKMENLLLEDDTAAVEHLKTARWLDFDSSAVG